MIFTRKQIIQLKFTKSLKFMIALLCRLSVRIQVCNSNIKAKKRYDCNTNSYSERRLQNSALSRNHFNRFLWRNLF